MNYESLNKTNTTAIKGIAILLVIIAHVGHGGFGIRYFVPLGSFGVAVFLILSGYGLMESYNRNSLIGFWKKRILRLFVPYLIWITGYSLYLFLSGKQIIINDLRYWFVEYIIIWYIAFYIIMKFLPRYKWPLFILLASLLFWFKPCLQAQQSLSFIIGILLSCHKEYVNKLSFHRIFQLGLICISICLISLAVKQWIVLSENNIPIKEFKDLLIVKNVDDDYYYAKFIQIITKTPIAVFVIIFLDYVNIGNIRICYLFGIISYELYLVHIPLYLNISHQAGRTLLFIFTILILSYLLHWINDKVLHVVYNCLHLLRPKQVMTKEGTQADDVTDQQTDKQYDKGY